MKMAYLMAGKFFMGWTRLFQPSLVVQTFSRQQYHFIRHHAEYLPSRRRHYHIWHSSNDGAYPRSHYTPKAHKLTTVETLVDETAGLLISLAIDSDQDGYPT